jgi:hypothetical protein
MSDAQNGLCISDFSERGMCVLAKKECPICDHDLVNWDKTNHGNFVFDCPQCGEFILTPEANEDLPQLRKKHSDSAQLLSHSVYRMSMHQKDKPSLDEQLIEQVLSNGSIPSPIEQLDNLVLWLGRSQSSLGDSMQVTERAVSAIGTKTSQDVGFLIGQAKRCQFIEGNVIEIGASCEVIGEISLSLNGWRRFDELTRQAIKSRRAIIAMKFGDPEFDEMVRTYFKPAVEATGFELKRIDEQQPAGLIDDQMRVEIRQCRFLIADLSHHNNGAYWEAGFAEGLGKPVIYTCLKNIHEGDGTHFDTNHHLTVAWDPKNMPDAMAKLKATIRATLPEEAKLSD